MRIEAAFLSALLLTFLSPLDKALAQDVDLRAGDFPDVDHMETSLVRGVSTKSDVISLLGRPSGRGGALSKLQPNRPREIWLYEELNTSLIDVEAGTMRIRIAHQFLMVFFLNGKFDGFWWHDTSGASSAALGP